MYNPLEVGGVDDYPVKVGSMLLTLVEPNPGFERAYNRWYERDHYYGGCMVGPWLFAGSRWVATRPLKDLRWPADEHGRGAHRRRQLRGHLLGRAGPPPRALRRVVDQPGARPVRPRARVPRADPCPHLDLPLRGHRLPRRRPGPGRTGPRPGLRGPDRPVVGRGVGHGPGPARHPGRRPTSTACSTARPSRSPRHGCPRSPTPATRAPRWTSAPLPAGPTGWCSCCSWTGTRPPRSTGSGPTPTPSRRSGDATLRLAAPFRRTVPGTDRYVDEL